ncbi:MAG: hypothetical protein V1859_02350 [archaeon]
MNPKYKIGDKARLLIEGKEYSGEIFIRDNTDNGWRYDVMCSKPKKILIKHVYEKKLL